jgi:putative heme-binding domain-containing protein
LETLLTLLTQQPHPELRAAAAHVLVRSPSPDAAYAFVTTWTTIPPSLRPEILGAFLRHETWTDILLAAVDRGFVAAPEITPANRQRLLNHPDPELRARAEIVFRETLPPIRQSAFDLYAASQELTGNPERGSAVFEERCQLCHAFNSVGAQVGPDLAGIGQRTPQQLLTSILSPSQSIEPRYRSYQVDTTDGRSLTGILEVTSDESLSIRQPGGHQVQLPAQEVRYVRASNLSLMPEGIDAGLAPQAMADLLAFLLRNPTQTSAGRIPQP